MDIKDIILIILVFVNIYLIYKINFENKSEKFGPTTQPSINQMIANTYKVDLDAMRNLGQLAGDILEADTLTIPATTTVATDVNITGNLSATDVNITGNLNAISTFNYKNNDIRNYLIGAYFNEYLDILNEMEYYTPTLLLQGKYNLIVKTPSDDEASFNVKSINIIRIGVNSGFRIKLWTGIFNNLSEDATPRLLTTTIPSQYYTQTYNANTPAIIENTSNTPIVILAPNDGAGNSIAFLIKSIEVEFI